MTKRKSKTPSTVIWYNPSDLNDYGAMTFRFEVFKALHRREAELGFFKGLLVFYKRFDLMRQTFSKVGLTVESASTLYDYLTEQMGERFLVFERDLSEYLRRFSVDKPAMKRAALVLLWALTERPENYSTTNPLPEPPFKPVVKKLPGLNDFRYAAEVERVRYTHKRMQREQRSIAHVLRTHHPLQDSPVLGFLESVVRHYRAVLEQHSKVPFRPDELISYGRNRRLERRLKAYNEALEELEDVRLSNIQLFTDTLNWFAAFLEGYQAGGTLVVRGEWLLAWPPFEVDDGWEYLDKRCRNFPEWLPQQPESDYRTKITKRFSSSLLFGILSELLCHHTGKARKQIGDDLKNRFKDSLSEYIEHKKRQWQHMGLREAADVRQLEKFFDYYVAHYLLGEPWRDIMMRHRKETDPENHNVVREGAAKAARLIGEMVPLGKAGRPGKPSKNDARLDK